MTNYFVSRHPGAKAWAENEALNIDCYLQHIQIEQVTAGDCVFGSLPVNLVAELNAKGVRYFHLTLPLTAALRGQEITAAQMKKLGAGIQEYQVKKV